MRRSSIHVTMYIAVLSWLSYGSHFSLNIFVSPILDVRPDFSGFRNIGSIHVNLFGAEIISKPRN